MKPVLTPVTSFLPLDLYEKMAAEAKAQGLSQSKMIGAMVECYFEDANIGLTDSS